MFETSYIELNSQVYKRNLDFLKKSIASNKSKLCLVIKGNAYGHGASEIAGLAQKYGVNTFAVFNAHEARDVYKSLKPKTRLIIMGDIDYPELEWAIQNGIEFYVYSLDKLKVSLKIAAKLKKRALLHFELETGMNRLGFEVFEYEKIIKTLEDSKEYFDLMGLCTHFAGAESISNFVRIKKQIKNFEKSVKFFKEKNFTPKEKHAACSAAAVRFKKTRYQMIRIGILQYGFWPSQETFIDFIMNRVNKKNPINRVITWKSRVMSLKNASLGEYVGYGTSFFAEDEKRLAVIPVGYGDGFARSLSNQGRVLIKGKFAPVAGIVNMNAITVDVTDNPDVKVGDEVVLIGDQEEQSISVASFSDFSNQLNYELLARLPKDIPRFIK